MKKVISIIMSLLVVLSLCACSSDSQTDSGIQGVSVRESGDVTVTFRTAGKGIEEVIGSKLGKKNTFYVSSVTDNSGGFYVDWYHVESGGIISKRDGIYRYCPTATVSSATGTTSPPNWVLIMSMPSEDDIFKPEDADILLEQYGITLNY